MNQTIFHEELTKFPLKLRKLALFIAESKDFMSLSKYSKAAGMSPNTTISMICQARRKGNDFNELLNKIYKDKLIVYKPQVMDALVRKAIKGSHRHQELYFRLCGDLKHEPSNIDKSTNTSLTFILQMPQHIDVTVQPTQNGHDSAENQGEVIDVEPESSSMKMIEKDHSE